MDFDGRGLKCPLAFVKAKQALKKSQAQAFLFDDTVSFANFISYLQLHNVPHITQIEHEYSRVILDQSQLT